MNMVVRQKPVQCQQCCQDAFWLVEPPCMSLICGGQCKSHYLLASH